MFVVTQQVETVQLLLSPVAVGYPRTQIFYYFYTPPDCPKRGQVEYVYYTAGRDSAVVAVARGVGVPPDADLFLFHTAGLSKRGQVEYVYYIAGRVSAVVAVA